MKRKVTQISVAAGIDSVDILYALCSDGTLWWCECTYENHWRKMNDVPQDEAGKTLVEVFREEGRKD